MSQDDSGHLLMATVLANNACSELIGNQQQSIAEKAQPKNMKYVPIA
jgi:hypothetical protein